MSLRRWITEPELLGVDLEDSERIRIHAQILARKPMLRGVFEEFYHLFMKIDADYFGDTPGKKVELGAGVSLFKKYYPEVYVTDVVPAPHLDAVVDAERMPFAEGSVRVLFGQSFFHHLSDPEKFFREASRVLRSGGGCVLLEPYYGPVATQFYKKLHATETFDKSDQWGSSDRGAMLGANQALSYIVFKRDREKFLRQFPEFEMVYEKPLASFPRYFFSGGLNFHPVLPNLAIGPLKFLESFLTPLLPWVALYQMVAFRKKKTA